MSNTHEETSHWSQPLWKIIDAVSSEHDDLVSTALCRQKSFRRTDIRGETSKKGAARYLTHGVGTKPDMAGGRKEKIYTTDGAIFDLLRTNIKLSKFDDGLGVSGTAIFDLLRTNIKLSKFDDGLGVSGTANEEEAAATHRKKAERQSGRRSTTVLLSRKTLPRTTKARSPMKSSLECGAGKMGSNARKKARSKNTADIDKNEPKAFSDNEKESSMHDGREDRHSQNYLPDIPYEHHVVHKEDAMYRVMPVSCQDERPPHPIDTDEKVVMENTDCIQTVTIDPYQSRDANIGQKKGNTAVNKSQMRHACQIYEKDESGDFSKPLDICREKVDETTHLNMNTTISYQTDKHENLTPSSICFFPLTPKEPVTLKDNSVFTKSPRTHDPKFCKESTSDHMVGGHNVNLKKLSSMFDDDQLLHDKSVNRKNATFSLTPKEPVTLMDNSVFTKSPPTHDPKFCKESMSDHMVESHNVNLKKLSSMFDDDQLLHDKSVNHKNATFSCQEDKHANLVTNLSLLSTTKSLSNKPQKEESKYAYEDFDTNSKENCVTSANVTDNVRLYALSKSTPPSDSKVQSPKATLSTTSKDANRLHNFTHGSQLYPCKTNSKIDVLSHKIASNEQDKSTSHFERIQELESEMEETQVVLGQTEKLLSRY